MSHNSTHIPDTDGRQLPQFNRMQTIKRRFFAMRNGELARQMRCGGLEYRINFGLNIPQIKEIAAEVLSWELSVPEQASLAAELWSNSTTRESMLMAPMIFPPEVMTPQLASEWMAGASSTEVADLLCHSLLRRLPFAPEAAAEMLRNPDATDISRYTALRLMLNLLMLGKIAPEVVADAVDAESSRACPLTASLCRRILQEMEFLGE